MLSYIGEGDRIINPNSWNTILIRDGVPYSVNHYPERRMVEIRYELDHEREFEQLGIKPGALGFTFSERGYRVGSAIEKAQRR